MYDTEDHVVAFYTMGSFREFVTDPMTEADARAFIKDPPDIHKPRPQDSLVLFTLDRVEDEEEDAGDDDF